MAARSDSVLTDGHHVPGLLVLTKRVKFRWYGATFCFHPNLLMNKFLFVYGTEHWLRFKGEGLKEVERVIPLRAAEL